jgi:hypothetical protein
MQPLMRGGAGPKTGATKARAEAGRKYNPEAKEPARCWRYERAGRRYESAIGRVNEQLE